ncbi:RNA pyrophosphohydrolase [uncultured archaeon]|nr:RNA pyrophosphohydrolase [uncultured archaeon]
MIHLTEPINFKSKFEVASCFLEHEEDALYILRQDKKPYGNHWGVPAGKLDNGESPLVAMIREVREETGIFIHDNNADYFGMVFVRYPEFDFIYHMFRASLDKKEKVTLNPIEHKDFIWASPKDALLLPLIPDEDACIKLVYGF